MVATKGRGGKSGGGGDGAGSSGGGGSGSRTQPECCMCGDYGYSEMLFRCKICNFRSQHKYCSNEYPKAESYKACNWCLTQKHESGNSTTTTTVKDRRDDAVKNKRNPIHKISQMSLRERRKASEIKVTKTAPINKLLRSLSSSPGESPVSTGRKRVAMEKNHAVLRKLKSANFDGGVIITKRPVFRNKVRRYKLLEEVSSQ